MSQSNGMKKYDVLIVGGGAAGIVAGIISARAGRSVLIVEKMQKLGKKLLITGAGRCNLLNEKISASFYNEEAKELVECVLSKFGQNEIAKFFKELGLWTYADESGRIFPITNQAVSVLKVLEMELSRQKVSVSFNNEVKKIKVKPQGFEVITKKDEKIFTKKIILTGGGKSYPALGSDGSAYELAKSFGHKIIEPVPVAVPILVKDSLCHFLQGQKIRASVLGLINKTKVCEASGEILFTQYGLSGTAILDASEKLSIAINRDGVKDVLVEIDMVPFLDEEELVDELNKRARRYDNKDDLLEGILPHKFSLALKNELQNFDAIKLAQTLKRKKFKVLGTKSWNEAEFTAGGIPTKEIDFQNLESKFQKGLFFAGEIINVHGKRGGYNLAFAWASGMLSGEQ